MNKIFLIVLLLTLPLPIVIAQESEPKSFEIDEGDDYLFSVYALPPKEDIKTYNPFNIKKTGTKDEWVGSIITRDTDYAEFISIEYAVRAVTRIFYTYQIKWGKTNIDDVFYTYVQEEGTDWYHDLLSEKIGLGRNEYFILFDADGNIIEKELLVSLIYWVGVCESGSRDITLAQIEGGISYYERDFVNKKGL